MTPVMRTSIFSEFLEDRRNEFWREMKSAFCQSLEKWPCRHYEPSALRFHNDTRRPRATQTESPCGFARRQLVEDHQRMGSMCKRRPNRAGLAVVQRGKQRTRGNAPQYTDLPTPYRRSDLRLARTTESCEHL